LTMRALKDGNLLNKVCWVKDGAEALDFLYHRGQYTDVAQAPRPGLILLDIKLTKVEGRAVLSQINSNEDLRAMPVVLLRTSSQEDEVRHCYAIGANSYVSKPVRFNDFVEQVKAVKLYWTLTSVLPEA